MNGGGTDGAPPEVGEPADDTRTVSWRELLAETSQRLASATVETTEAEARWLVEEASGLTGVDLLLALDEPATVRGVARLDAMVARRLLGEPVQYVLGHWPFRELDLFIDHRVLIPRPETEGVCGHALACLDRLGAVAPGAPPRHVVDLGAGSGALGLSIAVERPGTQVWLVEQSADAAVVTRANVAGQGRVGRHVRVLEGSWFEPLPPELQGRVDLIVTNPPYVAADDDLPTAVRDWEPRTALVSGETGLEALQAITEAAPVWLRPGGVLVVEIGETQGSAARELARARGFEQIDVHPDLAGRPRTLVAHLPGATTPGSRRGPYR